MGTVNIQQNKKFRNHANEKVEPVKGTDWPAFLDALGRVEGNNKYDIANGLGYYGMYQQGSAVVETDLDFFQNYGKFLGVNNLETFKNNPIAQELAGVMEFSGESGTDMPFFSKYTATKEATSLIPREHFDALLGKTFTINWNKSGETFSNTFTVNKASISGAAHLIGQGGVARALEAVYQKAFDTEGHLITRTISLNPNDKHFADGNHIAFSTYMELFDDYNVDPLIKANGKDDFVELYGEMLHYRKDKLTEYITAYDNLIIKNATQYKDEIQTTIDELDKSNLSVKGKESIVLAGKSVSDATRKDDLIISLDNGIEKTLNGGVGVDTYKVNANDTIQDADKQGKIYFDATLLSGIKYKVSEGLYEDAMFYYTEKDESLIIVQKADPSKSVTVEHWDNKSKEALGIKLSDEKVDVYSETQKSIGVSVDISEIDIVHKKEQSQEPIHPPSVQAYLDQFTPTNDNVIQKDNEVRQS